MYTVIREGKSYIAPDIPAEAYASNVHLAKHADEFDSYAVSGWDSNGEFHSPVRYNNRGEFTVPNRNGIIPGGVSLVSVTHHTARKAHSDRIPVGQRYRREVWHVWLKDGPGWHIVKKFPVKTPEKTVPLYQRPPRHPIRIRKALNLVPH